jgi:PAS domain S-box-containing protein
MNHDACFASSAEATSRASRAGDCAARGATSFRFAAARSGVRRPMIESSLRAIVDTAADGIILMDASGKVTMFNHACERMFGYDSTEIVGGDIERLIPASEHDDPDRYREDQRTGQSKITGIGGEVMGRRRDGETFPLEVSVGEAEHDGQTFYVGILKDVTERKRGDEVRERVLAELAASNEERAHFVYAASHDLKEPLRMVEAFCGLLSTDYGERLDDQGREYLSLTIAAAAQMRRRLEGLGDFSRLGSEVEHVSWIDTGASLDQVTETLHDAIAESGAQISRSALPMIWGSPIRFARVLHNLIGNALIYTQVGVAPRIHVSAERSGDFWRFAVSDNGIGIAPRHMDRIFEPFKRLHGKENYPDVGLGLTICRKIVEGFGGRIWARSIPGEGSTFCFTIKTLAEKTGSE